MNEILVRPNTCSTCGHKERRIDGGGGSQLVCCYNPPSSQAIIVMAPGGPQIAGTVSTRPEVKEGESCAHHSAFSLMPRDVVSN